MRNFKDNENGKEIFNDNHYFQTVAIVKGEFGNPFSNHAFC
jgi:hypothetical protein